MTPVPNVKTVLRCAAKEIACEWAPTGPKTLAHARERGSLGGPPIITN